MDGQHVLNQAADELVKITMKSMSPFSPFAVRQQAYVTRREGLMKCHRIDTAINRLRSEIKKEDQFHRRVELKVTIKDLEKQLDDATAQ